MPDYIGRRMRDILARTAATALILDISGRYMFPIAIGIIPNTAKSNKGTSAIADSLKNNAV
ncbi:hypothetical protein [Maribacter cobaltidurans]|uniref:Uncharacterized protein n=1 Tax=Maribacter cobaltidurans TaxID=1178778 RepID=A0A223V9N3_9FLAO|nr:hypothetical protein [Maribacter cobaltidurans]ASV31977.1 hypothetical protein CJ263_18120 [Maribacter cobaltidurans]GGD86174.1 hypothetical protein GCM10011412_24990 [Maribacter cobaltidurans]